MTATTAKTYKVITTNGERSVVATRVEREDGTGRLNFYNGDDLVAGFLNVSDFFVDASAGA